MLWAAPPMARECHGVAPLFFSKFVRRISPLVFRFLDAGQPSLPSLSSLPASKNQNMKRHSSIAY
jgi:hypothetical protein